MIQCNAYLKKEINEQKMKLYYGNIYSLEELLHAFEIIDTEHFIKVADYINEQVIIPIIKKFFMYNRLKREKLRMINQEFSNIDYVREKLMIGDKRFIISTVNNK